MPSKVNPRRKSTQGSQYDESEEQEQSMQQEETFLSHGGPRRQSVEVEGTTMEQGEEDVVMSEGVEKDQHDDDDDDDDVDMEDAYDASGNGQYEDDDDDDDDLDEDGEDDDDQDQLAFIDGIKRKTHDDDNGEQDGEEGEEGEEGGDQQEEGEDEEDDESLSTKAAQDQESERKLVNGPMLTLQELVKGLESDNVEVLYKGKVVITLSITLASM
jgi:hypothetical protein